jgi:hypothetical protein
MLREAYDRASAIIGSEAESIEIAEEVERLRLAWRPSRVRIVMLAESHVWTSKDESLSRVRQPDGIETGFVRFVYCLGYGERSLVVPSVLPNGGTPQYWRLFHDAVRGPQVPIGEIGGKAKPIGRIAAKLQLLNELKLAGIWLVDASVTALYRLPGNRRLSWRGYKKVLRVCWETHIADLIADCRASAVLIVGKGVNDAIGDLVRQLSHHPKVDVVMQPNARMTQEERLNERRAVFDFCRP